MSADFFDALETATLQARGGLMAALPAQIAHAQRARAAPTPSSLAGVDAAAVTQPRRAGRAAGARASTSCSSASRPHATPAATAFGGFSRRSAGAA